MNTSPPIVMNVNRTERMMKMVFILFYCLRLVLINRPSMALDDSMTTFFRVHNLVDRR